jgi:hypothetical protein
MGDKVPPEQAQTEMKRDMMKTFALPQLFKLEMTMKCEGGAHRAVDKIRM